MKHKKIIPAISAFLILLIASGVFFANRTKTQMKELFRMNKELQEEGYYMAEFEFKMLGIAYYLDKGHYYTSLSRINQLHTQLHTKAGLIKMPEFTHKEEELEFYLNLQNPHTGAFMDESYPFCSYTGPTGNVLLHLDALAEETGRPLELTYSLKYLDDLNSPERLNAYLDDVSTVGWIASKFPQTSFHFARDLLSLYYEDNIIEKHKLYTASPEFKEALLQWFYDNQDPETGLWGPKSKSGKLMKKDLSNTVSIMKAFVDKEGNNIHESFPLRYKNELSTTILEELFAPIPQDDALEEWHEWNLKTIKALNSLTRYLWDGLSQENKEKAREAIEFYIGIKFEKFYIPEEGAFSYYPHGDHATLDGSDGFFIFREIGAFSAEKQQRLWGDAKKTSIDLGIHHMSDLEKSDFDLIVNAQDVNSLRMYTTSPDYDNLTAGIAAVMYPHKVSVLDIVDLTAKMKQWIRTTTQTMGNWVSKEEIIRDLDSITLEDVSVYKKDIPLERANEILQKHGKLVVIGFDILQVPRYEIVYEMKK